MDRYAHLTKDELMREWQQLDAQIDSMLDAINNGNDQAINEANDMLEQIRAIQLELRVRGEEAHDAKDASPF